jgi:hypothetical protein
MTHDELKIAAGMTYHAQVHTGTAPNICGDGSNDTWTTSFGNRIGVVPKSDLDASAATERTMAQLPVTVKNIAGAFSPSLIRAARVNESKGGEETR